MPYTLENFTRQAPPALFKLAQAHVAAGQVHNLEQLDGEWVAEVADDNQSFTVAVSIGPKGELLATCSCDDVEHDLCRHALATLLEAAKHKQDPAKAAKAAKPAPAKKPNKNTATGRMREALNAAPHAVLVELLVKISARDKPMQNLIMMEVADIGGSLESYREAVKGALSLRGGRDAWYDGRKLRIAQEQLRTLLARAEESLALGEVDKSLMMAAVVIEEIARTTDKVGFSEIFEEPSTDARLLIARNFERLSPEERGSLFAVLVRIGQMPHALIANVTEFLGLLVEMVESPAARARVEPMLAVPRNHPDFISTSGPARKDPFWDYDANNYMLLQRRLVERLDGPEASRVFCRRNLVYGNLRLFLIRDAVERKAWVEVEELASEGMRRAEELSLRGLIATYREFLIQATDALGGATPTTLRDQFIATQTPAAYARWKASVPPDQWAVARANLLATFRISSERMCTILAAEEAWRDLMDWLLRFVNNIHEISPILENQALKLLELYPDDMARLCIRNIEARLDAYMPTRNDYRLVAELLKQMNELGLSIHVHAEIARLRVMYPKRSALLEELARI